MDAKKAVTSDKMNIKKQMTPSQPQISAIGCSGPFVPIIVHFDQRRAAIRRTKNRPEKSRPMRKAISDI